MEKRREIYFIDNVKFHLDEVRGHGCFVEIEAVDVDESIGAEQLARRNAAITKRPWASRRQISESLYSELLTVHEE